MANPLNEIPINIPGAVVKGHLFDVYDDPRALDQDVLEIDLPNGLTIDVGWYPENSFHGSFRVMVYRDHIENAIVPVFEAGRDPQQLARLLEDLAQQLADVTSHTFGSSRPA